jgi:hypothetical protein
MNPFDDNRADGNDDLTELLNELPEVDPPATIVPTVMSTIAGSAKAVTTPRVTTFRRGSTMAKKVLWSLAGAAAVALVALRVVGYPPVKEGTEATIGAAQRYQAPQVAAADVKVEDQQFQDFLQSDLFRELVNDKAAQEAVQNPDLQKALADVNVRALLAQNDARIAIANNARYLVRADARREAIANLKLDAKLHAALAAALEASPALVAAISQAHVADALAQSSLARILARPDAALALSNDAVLRVMHQASVNARNDDAANAINK